MSRKVAFLIIALLGFSIGVILYVVGVFLIPFIIAALPYMEVIFKEYKYILGAVASGVIGSIIAVIIAYIWATRSGF